MLKILDRQMTWNYLKGYLVCAVSLLGLFIVIDLFMNLDAFTEGKKDLMSIFRHIGLYYTYKTPQIYDRLNEAIVQMAAMFTIAWVQRNNELLPLLSAGVSTRRVVRPLLLASCAMMLLAVANQELVLPKVDLYLLENRNDLLGEKESEVRGGWELNGTLISGRVGFKKDRMIKDFFAVLPNIPGVDSVGFLQASEAKYEDGVNGKPGGWLMKNTHPPEMKDWKVYEKIGLTYRAPGVYFLQTEQIDFDKLTRHKNWVYFVTTPQLLEEMRATDGNGLAGLAVRFHKRLTRPILGMLLTFMGLSIILQDQNRNVFISTGMSLSLTALFFIADFASKHLGDHQILPPALAAWLPVMVFGPVSFVLFDMVHT